MLYNFQTKDLIIKLISGVSHEAAHLYLTLCIVAKITAMGLGPEKLYFQGSATFKGSSSSKQGDSAIKPSPERRMEADWHMGKPHPTLARRSMVACQLRKRGENRPGHLLEHP